MATIGKTIALQWAVVLLLAGVQSDPDVLRLAVDVAVAVARAPA